LAKIYLDTSIPSAPFDATKPLRNHITTEWFINDAKHYELYISSLTIKELEEWSNVDKRNGALAILAKASVNILEINDKMQDLAALYIKKGAIPATEIEDALHLACATLNGIPYFISWDFRHIVSVNPMLKIQEIHRKMNLSPLHIGTLSLVGGDQYGVFAPDKFLREIDKLP
jgi:predicted nucleic acid-binding protein